ncbi:metal-dependent hydrolase [Vibrio sp. PNB22_3_1]
MTGKGHRFVGFALSFYPSAIYEPLGLPVSMMCALACVVGSTAPDWMEIRRKKRAGTATLIKHRTLTHTLSFWVLLLIASHTVVVEGLRYFGIDYHSARLADASAVVASFCLGGISHIACDLFNRRPVSIFTPLDRFALNIWKCTDFEVTISMSTVALTVYLVHNEISLPTFLTIHELFLSI